MAYPNQQGVGGALAAIAAGLMQAKAGGLRGQAQGLMEREKLDRDAMSRALQMASRAKTIPQLEMAQRYMSSLGMDPAAVGLGGAMQPATVEQPQVLEPLVGPVDPNIPGASFEGWAGRLADQGGPGAGLGGFVSGLDPDRQQQLSALSYMNPPGPGTRELFAPQVVTQAPAEQDWSAVNPAARAIYEADMRQRTAEAADEDRRERQVSAAEGGLKVRQASQKLAQDTFDERKRRGWWATPAGGRPPAQTAKAKGLARKIARLLDTAAAAKEAGDEEKYTKIKDRIVEYNSAYEDIMGFQEIGEDIIDSEIDAKVESVRAVKLGGLVKGMKPTGAQKENIKAAKAEWDVSKAGGVAGRRYRREHGPDAEEKARKVYVEQVNALRSNRLRNAENIVQVTMEDLPSMTPAQAKKAAEMINGKLKNAYKINASKIKTPADLERELRFIQQLSQTLGAAPLGLEGEGE